MWHVCIYTAESTGASMERTKMPNLRNGSKAGFEPVLAWLRVRHSIAELPRSDDVTFYFYLYYIYLKIKKHYFITCEGDNNRSDKFAISAKCF